MVEWKEDWIGRRETNFVTQEKQGDLGLEESDNRFRK